jgi:hypothetical protein
VRPAPISQARVSKLESGDLSAPAQGMWDADARTLRDLADVRGMKTEDGKDYLRAAHT